jgi:hypothetical protein
MKKEAISFEINELFFRPSKNIGPVWKLDVLYRLPIPIIPSKFEDIPIYVSQAKNSNADTVVAGVEFRFMDTVSLDL